MSGVSLHLAFAIIKPVSSGSALSRAKNTCCLMFPEAGQALVSTQPLYLWSHGVDLSSKENRFPFEVETRLAPARTSRVEINDTHANSFLKIEPLQ